jgi:hypothetical protein
MNYKSHLDACNDKPMQIKKKNMLPKLLALLYISTLQALK